MLVMKESPEGPGEVGSAREPVHAHHQVILSYHLGQWGGKR